MQHTFTISPRAFQAVIFDLDGVVTKTARTHAAAWKQLFDDYLRQHSQSTGEPFRPFDIESDYREYVDGKPRYDGVRDFLGSRGIELPWGTPDEEPGAPTICGLGNRKNALFQQQLATHGVERYESTVSLIRQLREKKIRTAIVSSSRNCVQVLTAAGLRDLFDARVDGNDAARLGLSGKPNPDIYLRAARDLNVDPGCAVVIEDAIAGVAAGRSGMFGAVVGVDRAGYAKELREAGADVVLTDLEQVRVGGDTVTDADATVLPSALDCLYQIRSFAERKRAVVFLDYDGTLTPIVPRPEDAVLSPAMRSAVQQLATRFIVAIVSGRGLADVRSLVQLDGLWYAGSHGFEIAGPGRRFEQEQATGFLPLLDIVEEELRRLLSHVGGAQVERKRFSVAAHYRNVQRGDEPRVRQAVDEVLSKHEGLRVSPGKKVWDVQPAIEWNKGKALAWLLKALELNACNTMPIYIGDDITDEDAFREIQDRGVGIIVREEPRPTAAEYALNSVDEVRVFLGGLAAEVAA